MSSAKIHKADIIVGIQWGDEGKGRIVDYYSRDYDIVARFGGGDNAGHSIRVGDRKLALRIVPSGVLQERCELFIGGGTVVSLEGLLGELDSLAKIGVDVKRVRISDRAHVVFSYHAEADKAAEAARGAHAIGTTGRGIGPAYVDRVARSGITFGDLRDRGTLAEKLQRKGAQSTLPAVWELAQRVTPYVVDGVDYLHGAIENGKRLLIEGAQGSLLDVGYGTYPYVTSSHTIAGGACTGLGLGPTAIGRVVGVVKAYCTRVGGGPFPSELHDATGERLRTQGAEFGVVTGRPRRCGWFDAVAARYGTRVNGLTSAVITKLDVLTGFEQIGIVTGYRLHGSAVDFGAAGHTDLQTDVEYVPGWSEDLSGVRRIGDLPEAARSYVSRIEQALGVPVESVSVGPERSQIAV
ncbi:MAG TPA: adenylosuccinate synthase [Candidatus Baltobacteraceae bacterium]|jgi:adenylosuccinate synthase|nr:adenylosuccinate synthase [Candidatus Baltobacteraceae bacterium]